MSRRTFTKEEKIKIAEAWLAARDRGVRQEDFAADLGVSSRRIREYTQRYRPAMTVDDVRKVVEGGIGQLTESLNYIVAKIEASAPKETGAPDTTSAHEASPLRLDRIGGTQGDALVPVTLVEAPTSGGQPSNSEPKRFEWDLD